MTRVEKAVAKLYFSLGESCEQNSAEAGSIGGNAECLAYLAIRNTGESLGKRYFAMGAASALRSRRKPSGGKSSNNRKPVQLQPPGGSKRAKQASPARRGSKEPEWGDKDYEYGWEGDFDDSEEFVREARKKGRAGK